MNELQHSTRESGAKVWFGIHDVMVIDSRMKWNIERLSKVRGRSNLVVYAAPAFVRWLM